eukprot:8976755-Prorocentrum_lima.AAC.1
MCIRDRARAPPRKFECMPDPNPLQDEAVTFGAASTTQLNASWDVIDLMAMIVEVCVVETGVPGQDWCLKLHIPMKWRPRVVEEQFKLFK